MLVVNRLEHLSNSGSYNEQVVKNCIPPDPDHKAVGASRRQSPEIIGPSLELN